MSLEGRVTILLPRAPGGPVRVTFVQPGDIGRLVRGRTPAEALKLIPALYSVCATAQAHAAVTALEGALGCRVSPRTAAARQALTAMEALREHVLRIALDWPEFVSAQPQADRMRPVMTLMPSLAEALYGPLAPFRIGREAMPDADAARTVIATAETILVDEIFGEPLETWLERRGEEALSDWARTSATVAARLVGRIIDSGWQQAGAAAPVSVELPTAEQVREWLANDQHQLAPMAEAPDGGVPETTLFTRHAGDPLLTSLRSDGLAARLVARLVELARLPQTLRALVGTHPDASAMPPEGSGVGYAAIDAARGLLIHAVEIGDGVIVRYRILPPTRWNFDRRGVASRSLSRLAAGDEECRLAQAHLLVNTVDPCVAHDVRFH